MTAPGMVLAAVTGFCGSLKDSPGQKMLVPYPQTRGLHTILKSMGRVTRLSEHQMQRLQSALFSCRYSFHLLRRFFPNTLLSMYTPQRWKQAFQKCARSEWNMFQSLLLCISMCFKHKTDNAQPVHAGR